MPLRGSRLVRRPVVDPFEPTQPQVKVAALLVPFCTHIKLKAKVKVNLIPHSEPQIIKQTGQHLWRDGRQKRAGATKGKLWICSQWYLHVVPTTQFIGPELP